MKAIYLLGATGSIGSQVLDICVQYPNQFVVKTMTANHSVQALRKLITIHHPEFVSVGTLTDSIAIKAAFPDIEVGYGAEGLIQAATWGETDPDGLLVNALVGIVGLIPTVRAIEKGRHVALANKETLVVAGDLINELLKKHHSLLYPIDSEHSAIWQCLNGEEVKKVKRIIITASGGSFRDYPIDRLASVTVEEALKHPNWSMGKKITIDSATMMNKGFEVIEAHHLFGVAGDMIETVMHRESIIHSMVEFVDYSVKAQLSDHDMHLPIAYALFYPIRMESSTKALDFAKIKNLSFEPLSLDRYPCLQYAYEALRLGGNAGAIVNAANEAAVDLFLKRKISFLMIESLIGKALQETLIIDHPSLEQLLSTDASVKDTIYRQYQ